MIQDVRYALRYLRKSPLFAGVACLTLAFGVGATTAIFSLVDAVLLKTLPVHNPKALVALGQFSYPMIEALSARQDAFSALFSWSYPALAVGPGARAELAPVQMVSGEYFPTLGVSAHLGRTITVEDVTPTPRNVAMIGYRYWEREYGRDPDVLGRTLLVQQVPLRIVGVASPEFMGLNVGTPPKVYVPIATASPVIPTLSLEVREFQWLSLVGRLGKGVTMTQAQAQMEAIWPQVLRDTVPHEYQGGERTCFLSQKIRLRSVSRGESYLRRDFSQALFFLMTVAGLFFFLACCNVAGLLLVRGMAREKEMAIRLSLGGSRWRLIRQLLIESLLLSIPGGVLGLVFGHLGARLFFSFLSQRLPYSTVDLNLSLDYRILLFVSVLSLLNGITFGLLPAWRTTRASPNTLLKGEMHLGERHRSLWGPSRILVSVQMALSLLLLIVAGLFLRSFTNLSSVDLGFPRDGLLLVRLHTWGDSPDAASRAEYCQQLLHRTNAILGVRSASLSQSLPLGGYYRTVGFAIGGRETRPEETTRAYISFASPDFFQTLGLPLKEGRDFSFADRDTAPRVAVINESMARTFFPAGDAVGSYMGLQPNPEENQAEVIGVVADTIYRDPRERGSYAIYLSCFQDPRMVSLGLLIRTFNDPTSVEGAVREVMDTLGRQGRISVTTFNELTARVTFEDEVVAMLSSFFSISGLVLAAMGLYALTAYTVTRRTYEIGIRIALGAKRADVQWLILRDALLVTMIGVTIGVLSALAASRIIGSVLFGLTPTDPRTLSLAAALIFLISTVAAIVPAAKATRLDPVKALREM